MNDPLAAHPAVLDILDQLVMRLVRAGLPQQQLGISDDGRERAVQLVSHPGGHLAQGDKLDRIDKAGHVLGVVGDAVRLILFGISGVGKDIEHPVEARPRLQISGLLRAHNLLHEAGIAFRFAPVKKTVAFLPQDLLLGHGKKVDHRLVHPLDAAVAVDKEKQICNRREGDLPFLLMLPDFVVKAGVLQTHSQLIGHLLQKMEVAVLETAPGDHLEYTDHFFFHQ